MTAQILLPEVVRAGVANRVRVRSSEWLSGASVVVAGGAPVACWRSGLQEWSADVVFPAEVFTPVTVDATATFLAGGIQVAPQVMSSAPVLDLPVASTGRVIPAAGAITAWGDFQRLTGAGSSTGAAVVLGSTGAPSVFRALGRTLQPSQTIAVVAASVGSFWPNTAYLCRTTETPGSGLSLNYQLSNYITGQVYGTGGYVSQLYPTTSGTSSQRLYTFSFDDTTDLATILFNGASSGANGSATIAATRAAVATNIDMQGDGETLFRFVGVWNRVLSAVDVLQLQAELTAAGLLP